jgi:septal ring factor EnvC (AmiA/AmiB activator)
LSRSTRASIADSALARWSIRAVHADPVWQSDEPLPTPDALPVAGPAKQAATRRGRVGAIEQAATRSETDLTALTEQRSSLGKEIVRAQRAIDRYHDAFEDGDLKPARFKERITALDTRLGALRDQDQVLARDLAADALAVLDTVTLRAVADNLDLVISRGEPERARALLGTLIVELRVNSRSEILPTYQSACPWFARRTVQWS